MSLESLPLDCLLIVLSSVATKDILALACANRSFSQQLKDDCVWRALAERKWGGTRVPELTARVRPGGWKAFCQHRISLASLPPSPLNLVQELYPDPWQHLAACLLCSRTTGGSAVRGAIAALLAALPTPSAVLDASKEALWELLHPLGLQAARCSALRNMSRDFLERWVRCAWGLPLHACRSGSALWSKRARLLLAGCVCLRCRAAVSERVLAPARPLPPTSCVQGLGGALRVQGLRQVCD